MPEEQPKRVKVVYLFAGKRRQSDVGTFLKELEAAGRITLELLEFDIERSESHDLRSIRSCGMTSCERAIGFS